MIYNNLNRIKGILSARLGAEIPKFGDGDIIPDYTNTEFIEFSNAVGLKAVSESGTAWKHYKIIKDTNPNASLEELINIFNSGQYSIPGQNSVEGNPNAAVLAAAELGNVNEKLNQLKKAERLLRRKELAELYISWQRANMDSDTLLTVKQQNRIDKIKDPERAARVQQRLVDRNTLTNLEVEQAVSTGAEIAGGAIQGLGNVFKAQQSATDSNLTKGIDSGVDAVGGMLSQMGGIAGGIGLILQIGSAAGQIIEGITGGTDQMTGFDKFTGTGIGLVLTLGINDLFGKNSDAFGIDLSMAETVGSSYGGSMDLLNEAARTADKKYGLISSNARKKANVAIGKAKTTLNLMSSVADTASDQRLAVQSMGEQAGLAYSMMTDGGYNLKYTYAAKQGGKLQDGGLIDFATSMIPIVGTVKDIKHFIQNPNKSNLGSMLLSGAGDLLTITGVGAAPGMALKVAKTADKLNDARKLTKSITNLPGFHLRGLRGGSVLEKAVSKSGKINVSAIEAYVKNASKLEQEIFQDVLNTQFKNKLVIDYNDFRKAVLDRLTQLHRRTDDKWLSYGIDGLGFTRPETTHTPSKEINTKTYIYSSNDIPKGHAKHYYDDVLMHSRTFTDPNNPDILYVMENQSDWSRYAPKTNDSTNAQHLKKIYGERLIHENVKVALENGQTVLRFPTVETGAKIQGFTKEKRVAIPRSVQEQITDLEIKLGDLWAKYFDSGDPRALHADDSISLEGMYELFPEYKIIRENLTKLTDMKYDYFDEYKSTLKKYADFPKLWKKIFNTEVKVVKDSKNNSWYEVRIPDDYLSQEWFYKHGGLLEWKPVIDLEWKPQVELNLELPTFKDGGSVEFVEELEWIPEFKDGGKTEESDVPEIEETTQKNVIPEGALHKNKHHMEHAEGLTKKGIPVVDEDGEQQAEIEHSEIIFTLEVTKKLEEYYEVFYSENATNKEKEQAALDAGKLLVYQILENTEDRTGLIESCKKGGSLTLKKSTDDLIEEVLEWMPTIVVVETEELEEKKEYKSEAKKELSEKDKMKEAIREVLIELLVK